MSDRPSYRVSGTRDLLSLALSLAVLLSGFLPAFHAALHEEAGHAPVCAVVTDGERSTSMPAAAFEEVSSADAFHCALCSTPAVTTVLDTRTPEVSTPIAANLRAAGDRAAAFTTRRDGPSPPRGPPVSLLLLQRLG